MKPVAAALISALLFSAVAGALLVNLARADPTQTISIPLGVSVSSPENNQTYAVNSVTLTVTVNPPTVPLLSVQYDLDEGAKREKIPVNATQPFSVTLTGLSEGTHSVEVTAVPVTGASQSANHFIYVYFWGSSGKVYFTVDTTPPSISILSLQGKTFDVTDVPLDFTVSEPASWVGYSMDGKANATITGSTVLTGLSSGTHSLTVYAKDTAGNTGESKTVHFTITQGTEPEPQPSQPFPTALIAASLASVAIVGAGLLVFFRKHNR